MNYLTKEQLLNVDGGLNITGTFISSIIKGISTIFDLGKSLGSSLRRIVSKKICPI